MNGAPDPTPPTPDVGVLFVHGIGTQPRGQTLRLWSEALLGWVQRWAEDGPAERLAGQGEATDDGEPFEVLLRGIQTEVVHGRLDSAPGDEASPPQARVELRRPGADPVRWLLAESWWAGTVAPPSFSSFARWALTVIPWTLQVQFGTRMRRAIRSRREGRLSVAGTLARVAWRLLLFLWGLFLALLLQVAVLLLLLLALVPSSRLRAWIGGLQNRLAATIGDSHALVSNQVQRAAIVERVRDDVTWMARRCGRLVVVAHSQGAAVSYMALRGMSPTDRNGRPVRLHLMTLGSGLGKLLALQRLARVRWRSGELLGALVVLVGLAMLIAVAAALAFGWHPAGEPLGGGLLVPLSLGFVFVVSGVAGNLIGGEPEVGEVPCAERWSDLYASADPVPNGPLLDSPPAWIESIELDNLGSAIGDHTSYWKNPDGWVAHLARELSAGTALPLDTVCTGDGLRLDQARHRRRWRVRWLTVARSTLWLAGGAAVWRLRGEAEAIGRPIRDTAARFAAWLDLLGDFLADAARSLRLDQPSVLGLIAMFAVVWLTQWLLRGTWRWWEAHDLSRLVHREPPDLGGFPFALFTGVWLSSLATAAALAVRGTLLPADAVFSRLTSWWAFLAVPLPAASMLLVVYTVGRYLVLSRRPEAPAVSPLARPVACGFLLAYLSIAFVAGDALPDRSTGLLVGRWLLAAVASALAGELFSLAFGALRRQLVRCSLKAPKKVRYDRSIDNLPVAAAAFLLAAGATLLGAAMLADWVGGGNELLLGLVVAGAVLSRSVLGEAKGEGEGLTRVLCWIAFALAGTGAALGWLAAPLWRWLG